MLFRSIAVYNVAPPAASASPAVQGSAVQHERPVAHADAVPAWPPAWTAALAVGLLAFVGAIAWRQSGAGRAEAPVRLSPAERENMLKEVVQWATSAKS